MVLWILIASLLFAQSKPKGLPTFDPADKEGLLVSPNPRIRTAWKRPVFWKLSDFKTVIPPGKFPPHTAAERQLMTAKLEALVSLLKATPTGTKGEGFWVSDSRTLGYQEADQLPAGTNLVTAPLRYETGLYPFAHEDLLVNGTWQLSRAGETESVYYIFNRLPGALGQKVVATEDRGNNLAPVEFYLRPRLTGSLGDLPLYENRELVITRQGRSPWTPVPLGRALKAALPKLALQTKTAEDRLAGLKRKNDEIQSPAWEKQFRDNFEKNYGNLKTTRPDSYKTRFASMERELNYLRQQAAQEASPQRDPKGAWYWNAMDSEAQVKRQMAALTPEAANQPACFLPYTKPEDRIGRYSLEGVIQPAGSAPDCQDIVMTNWAYFDPKLPRTTPQLLTIADFGRCAKLENGKIISRTIVYGLSPPQGCDQHAPMWREVDWQKIAALLAP